MLMTRAASVPLPGTGFLAQFHRILEGQPLQVRGISQSAEFFPQLATAPTAKNQNDWLVEISVTASATLCC